MDGKICPSCQIFKSFTDFAKNRSKRDGYQVYCKPCANEKTKAFFKTDKGKAAVRRANTSPAGRESQRRYRVTDKNKARAMRSAATEGYKVAHRKANRAYQLANKEKINAQSAVYNEVQRGRMPHVTTLTCSYCGNPAKHYHHHKGYDWENRLNVIPLCSRCHILEHHPARNTTGSHQLSDQDQ